MNPSRLASPNTYIVDWSTSGGNTLLNRDAWEAPLSDCRVISRPDAPKDTTVEPPASTSCVFSGRTRQNTLTRSAVRQTTSAWCIQWWESGQGCGEHDAPFCSKANDGQHKAVSATPGPCCQHSSRTLRGFGFVGFVCFASSSPPRCVGAGARARVGCGAAAASGPANSPSKVSLA